MCLMLHKSSACSYDYIMHNACMQVLDNLYALADNSRRDPRSTRHHN